MDCSKCQAPGMCICAPQPVKPTMGEILETIRDEVLWAESKFAPMNSAHEAYAVLYEEVDELWDHVKTNQKRRDIAAMRQEAVQVAAMAIRFIRDVCDGGRARV